jgi:DNA-binding transcriptional ArsR family regulator
VQIIGGVKIPKKKPASKKLVSKRGAEEPLGKSVQSIDPVLESKRGAEEPLGKSVQLTAPVLEGFDLDDKTFMDISGLFTALGTRGGLVTRIKITSLLLDHSYKSTEALRVEIIAGSVGIAYGTATEHLVDLKKAGLVERIKMPKGAWGWRIRGDIAYDLAQFLYAAKDLCDKTNKCSLNSSQSSI